MRAFSQSHSFDARGREIAPTAKIAADACYVCGSFFAQPCAHADCKDKRSVCDEHGVTCQGCKSPYCERHAIECLNRSGECEECANLAKWNAQRELQLQGAA